MMSYYLVQALTYIFSFCLPHIIFIKVCLEAKLGIILTGDSFTLVVIKANYSPLLFNSGYMCRQTYGVSVRFCQLINAINLYVPYFLKRFFGHSLRSQLNLIQETSGGKRISVNDLVIKVYEYTSSCVVLKHLLYCLEIREVTSSQKFCIKNLSQPRSIPFLVGLSHFTF
jgi:hypothetical protein